MELAEVKLRPTFARPVLAQYERRRTSHVAKADPVQSEAEQAAEAMRYGVTIQQLSALDPAAVLPLYVSGDAVLQRQLERAGPRVVTYPGATAPTLEPLVPAEAIEAARLARAAKADPAGAKETEALGWRRTTSRRSSTRSSRP